MFTRTESFLTKKGEFFNCSNHQKSSFEIPPKQSNSSDSQKNFMIFESLFNEKSHVSTFDRKERGFSFFDSAVLFESFFFPVRSMIHTSGIDQNWKKRKILENFCFFFLRSHLFFQKIFFYSFSFFKKKNVLFFPLTFFFLFFENMSFKQKNFSFLEIQAGQFLLWRSFLSFFSVFFIENFHQHKKNSETLNSRNQKIAQCFFKIPFYIASFSLKKKLSEISSFFCFSFDSLCSDSLWLRDFFLPPISFFSQKAQKEVEIFQKNALISFFSVCEKFSWFSGLEKILFEFSTKKKLFLKFSCHSTNFIRESLFLSSDCSVWSKQNFGFFASTKEDFQKFFPLFKRSRKTNSTNFSVEKRSLQSFFSFSPRSLEFCGPFTLSFFPTLRGCLKEEFFLFSNFSHCLKFQKSFWRISEKFLFLGTSFEKVEKPRKGQKAKNFGLSPICSCFYLFTTSFCFFSEKNLLSDLSFNVFKNYEFDQVCSSFSLVFHKKTKKFFSWEKNLPLEKVKTHLTNCQKILQSSLGKDQLSLMKKLKKEIFSWGNTWSDILSKRILLYCDFVLFQYLWKWARRTHPKKSKTWIRKKYFFCVDSNVWFFCLKKGNKRLCLPLHSQISKNESKGDDLSAKKRFFPKRTKEKI
jgi:hypothetical protein